MKQDTICAISTPPGSGGIAVIRLSVTGSHTIADQLFVPVKMAALLGSRRVTVVNTGG